MAAGDMIAMTPTDLPAGSIVIREEFSRHVLRDGPSQWVEMTVGKDTFFRDDNFVLPSMACTRKNVGYHEWGEDAHVMACDTENNGRQHGTEWEPPRGVAACVPPIYVVPPPHGSFTATTQQVGAFLDHHREMGISRFFMYVCDADVASHISLQSSDTTVLFTTMCTSTNMTMRAQNWMINECIQRAAAANFEWVLSCDIDERLAFEPGLSLQQLLAEHPKADAFTLGSVLRWRHPDGTVAGVRRHCQTRAKPEMCLGYDGHRKHLTRAHRLFVANLHFILEGEWVRRCRAGHSVDFCHIVHMNSSKAWLYHESATPRYSLRAWMGHLHLYRNESGRWPQPAQLAAGAQMA